MPDTPHRIAEIGPGLGDLTKYLVDVKSVTAFEVDTDLCKHLKHQFADAINTNTLELRCGDVLEHWKSELLDEPYDLVANLPYYIATNIILKALADPACRNLLVMIQREVAEKFSASPGERAFGALSVITQSVGEAEIVIHVPPTAFEPAPKSILPYCSFLNGRIVMMKGLKNFYERPLHSPVKPSTKISPRAMMGLFSLKPSKRLSWNAPSDLISLTPLTFTGSTPL